MRTTVIQLAMLGPMPASDDENAEAWLMNAEKHLDALEEPATDNEARLVAKLFGPDDCFGAAWALIHFIESAPGWPLQDVLDLPPNEWIELLQIRIDNAG